MNLTRIARRGGLRLIVAVAALAIPLSQIASARTVDRDRLYAAVADTGRRLDVVFANAAAIDVARIGDVTHEHLRKAVPLLNDGGSIIVNSWDGNADGTAADAAIVTALR